MQLLDCLVDSFGCKLICILSFLSFFRPQRKLKLHELHHFRLLIAVSGYISAIIARVAGGLIDNARFHNINLTPGELTCIGEGQGILIIQQPYRNALLQAYLVCFNQCKPIAGATGTSLSITVGKDEQVFIKENDAKACNIRYVSFLLKNKFYYQ